MSKQSERIECMSEILNEVGLTATSKQIQKIVEDFSLHLEMENELASYQYVNHKEPCKRCASLSSELERANKQINVYESSVKQRRKASHVWIENDTVMYE